MRDHFKRARKQRQTHFSAQCIDNQLKIKLPPLLSLGESWHVRDEPAATKFSCQNEYLCKKKKCQMRQKGSGTEQNVMSVIAFTPNLCNRSNTL